MPVSSLDSMPLFINSEVSQSYDLAQVVILPIPYEMTTLPIAKVVSMDQKLF